MSTRIAGTLQTALQPVLQTADTHMYMYMYLYVYVYVYAYVYVCVCVCVGVGVCVCMYVCIYIYIYSQAPFNYINSYSTYVDILHLPSTVIYSHPGPSACFSRVFLEDSSDDDRSFPLDQNLKRQNWGSCDNTTQKHARRIWAYPTENQ